MKGLLLFIGLVLLGVGIACLVAPEPIARLFGTEWSWWEFQEVPKIDPDIIRYSGIGGVVVGGALTVASIVKL